ncbi:hypothetical protein [Streptomyces fradiae]|uniref:hypothetical protein n=1 Tax=Streptomyces fradiae TaxID=1906 RepID=UPI003510EF4C
MRTRTGPLYVVWLLALLVGGAVAMAGLGRLDQSFTATGGPGHRANQEIHERYGNGAAVPPLVAVPPAGDPDAVARAAGPGARTVTRTEAGISYALVYPGAGKADLAGLAAVEETAERLRAAGAEVTGVLPLTADSAATGPGPWVLALKAACALGFLTLLALAFRSPLGVLAPLLLAATVTVGALLATEAAASVTPVSFVVVYLIPVTALLITVHRRTLPPEAATRSARTAGPAGAAAFAVLALFPGVFLRSIGIAGAAVCLVGLAVTVWLDPVLRSLARSGRAGGAGRGTTRRAAEPTPAAGPARSSRTGTPRRRTTRRAGAPTVGADRLPAPGRFRRPGLVSSRSLPLAALVLLLLCAGAAPLLRVGNPEARALVDAGPARAGLDRLTAAGVAPGVLNPLEVLVPSGAVGEVVRAVAGVPGVRFVVAPDGDGWRRGGTALVVVVPEEEPMTAGGARAVEGVRAAVAGTGALVGGSGVVDRDLVAGDYGLLPYAVPVAALAAFGVLVRRRQGLRDSARTLLGALLAAGAAAGGPVLLWQYGLAGTGTGTGAVTGWVPLVVGAFAFCVTLERPGPLAAGACALAVLAVGIGPQVELALLVSAFALTALLGALGARARLTPRSSPLLV